MYLPDCYSIRFTTLSNYYLIHWWCDIDFCLLACWIDFGFCYSYLTWETGGLELASTIILVLQANLLTKFASHSKGCLAQILLGSFWNALTYLMINVLSTWRIILLKISQNLRGINCGGVSVRLQLYQKETLIWLSSFELCQFFENTTE